MMRSDTGTSVQSCSGVGRKWMEVGAEMREGGHKATTGQGNQRSIILQGTGPRNAKNQYSAPARIGPAPGPSPTGINYCGWRHCEAQSPEPATEEGLAAVRGQRRAGAGQARGRARAWSNTLTLAG